MGLEQHPAEERQVLRRAEAHWPGDTPRPVAHAMVGGFDDGNITHPCSVSHVDTPPASASTALIPTRHAGIHSGQDCGSFDVKPPVSNADLENLLRL